MSRFVPHLADEAIKRDSASVIEEYENARGVTIEPPIPIEDIAALCDRLEATQTTAETTRVRVPKARPHYGLTPGEREMQAA